MDQDVTFEFSPDRSPIVPLSNTDEEVEGEKINVYCHFIIASQLSVVIDNEKMFIKDPESDLAGATQTDISPFINIVLHLGEVFIDDTCISLYL